MKNASLCLFFVILLCAKHAPAADNLLAGARANAMAGATIALYDFWNISHNQAGIAKINCITAGLYAENRFLQEELSLAAAAAILPTPVGVFGLSIIHFGSSLYSETKAGLAYARNFGEKLSAGLQLNYMHTSISDGYGNKGTITAEIGIIYEFLPNIRIGAHIFNPTKATLETLNHHDIDEYISTVIRSGMTFIISQNVLVSIEVEKDIRHSPVPKIGFEYKPSEIISIRAGVSNNPVMNAFGFGLNMGKLQLDISASYHHVLGYSPQAGVIYSF